MVLRPRGRGRVGRRRHLVRTAPVGSPGGGVVHPIGISFQSAATIVAMVPTPNIRRRYLSSMQRAGIVTVVGKPNAGKSTLLNRIVGQKLSITSPKPQSTRDRVVGIRTTGETQMVILDTPGLLEPRYQLQQVMRSTALTALADADVVVYVVDATLGSPPSLTEAASLDRPVKADVLTVLNKIDRATPAERANLERDNP